jgi:succinyl-CoA synthetase beta subunit
MEINPLIVDENGAVAVDARIHVDNVSPTAGTATTTWRSTPTPRT